MLSLSLLHFPFLSPSSSGTYTIIISIDGAGESNLEVSILALSHSHYAHKPNILHFKQDLAMAASLALNTQYLQLFFSNPCFTVVYHDVWHNNSLKWAQAILVHTYSVKKMV